MTNYETLLTVWSQQVILKLMDLTIEKSIEIKEEAITDMESLEIIEKIVNANYPICLEKYLKGENWKLD